MAVKKESLTSVVKSVVAQMQKKYLRQGGAALVMQGSDQQEEGRISTGCLALDVICGGGVYYGRPFELFGEHSTGKSLVLYHIAREAQRAGGIPIMVDVERSYERGYVGQRGIDTAALHRMVPRTVEGMTKMVMETVGSYRERLPEAPIVVLIDSLAAMTTKQRMEDGLDKVDMTKAKLIWGAIEVLVGALDMGKVAIVWSNQTRDRISTGWEPPGALAARKGPGKAATAGGKGPAFWAHMRVELTRLQPIKEGPKPVGSEPDRRVVVGEFVGCFCEKSKVAPPFGRCVLLHRFGKGLDRWHGLWDCLIRTGRLAEAGPGLWLLRMRGGDEVEFRFNDFREMIEAHPDVVLGV